MMWTCPNCKANTENDVCPQCGLPMEQGEASPATKLLKNHLSSASFIVGTICLTAALILTAVLGIIGYNPFTADSLKEATSAVGSTLNYTFPEGFNEQVGALVAQDKDTTVKVSLTALLLVIGCWLFIGQTGKKRIHIKNGGVVLCKISFIFNIVAYSILLVMDVLTVVGVTLFHGELMKVADMIPEDFSALGELTSAILESNWFQMALLIVCGALAIFFLIGILFNASLVRSANAVNYTCKTGNFTQKRVSLFAAIILIIMFVFNLAFGLFTLVLDMNMEGIAVLLNAIAYLLFAIALIGYRKAVGRIYAVYVDGMTYENKGYSEDILTEENVNGTENEIPMVESINVPQEEIVSQGPSAEELEQQRLEQERLAQQQAEQERLAQQQAEQERLAQQQAEQQRIAQQRAEQQRLAQLRAQQAAAQQAAAQQAVTQQPPVQPQAQVPQPSAEQKQAAKDEFEAFFARQQQAAEAQAEATKKESARGGKRCPRCGQPVNNPYFCMNCGLRL